MTGSPAAEILDRATGNMSKPVAGRHGRSREWYVVDERHVRIGAWAVAALLLVAAVAWVWRSNSLWDERVAICDSCDSGGFQWVQASLTVIGIVLVVALVAYLIRIAVTGRTWPYRRVVTIGLMAVAGVWSLLVIVAVWL